jgi:hypothetical protein
MQTGMPRFPPCGPPLRTLRLGAQFARNRNLWRGQELESQSGVPKLAHVIIAS